MKTQLWFDRVGMTAWVDGMSQALRRRICLCDLEGDVLSMSGEGEGETQRIKLEVNGVHEAWLDVTPAARRPETAKALDRAVETFRALAETRNSVADLVRTTATQWRELSVLYQSSELLRGGADADSVAKHLLQQATGAIPDTSGAVRYRITTENGDKVLSSHDDVNLEHVTEWAQSLDEGVLIGGEQELRRLGFRGDSPTCSLITVPLRSGGSSYGAITLAGKNDRMLMSEDLKLARLLAEQAGQAYANIALVEQARESERLQRELEVAAQIQTSILPPETMSNDWLEMIGVCRPATWVGGDAYIMLPTPDGQMIAGVADVSGHGVSSALLMNAFASQLTALSMACDDPGELLRITNNLIAERVGDMGMFVTTVLMRLSSNGTMVVANAGHPPLLVATAEGEVSQVEDSSLPLGIIEDEEFSVITDQVEPGGFVVAYSDGITEAKNPDQEMYGIDRIAESLARRVVSSSSIADVSNGMLEDLAGFSGGEIVDDDLTLVVLRRKQ